MKTILQTESSECGLACIAMVAAHHGHQTDLAELRRRFSISLKGVTLNQLMRHAASLHLSSRPLRLELEHLEQLQLPAILHWNLNHFVVLSAIKRDLRGNVVATIHDPATGERSYSMPELSRHFTGVVLELSPTAEFEEKKEVRKVSISELTGKVIGLRWAIAKVIMLAVALEVFALASPLFNQFVIDEVVVNGDRELLKVLVLGFALMLVTQSAISLARSWVLMRWGTDVALQWSTRVFTHLIRLPVSYFEKRHLGDVVSRFGSMNAIQTTLTSLFVESMLDGLMALLAFGMMLAYSPKLTCVVLGGLAAYIALRVLAYHPLRAASQERLVLSAKENSHFLETVRAIVPLKLFGREVERRARWLNLKQDVVNRDIQTQKLGILFKLGSSTLSSGQALLLFYVGALLVMDNALTIGMLMAFTSYSTTFTGRVFGLVDLYIDVKMLGMHAERLADIVKEPAEPEDQFEADVSRITPAITLRNVRFRYAEGEPWILDSIDLHIPAGQSLALVGPSGCGKTTLCKLVLGLLQPTEGEILVDDIPLRQLGLRAYRSLIGTVMQDDVLLAGSILDNISFFDNGADPEKVKHYARLAAIHDDIAAMPMAYQTLVGDMGSSLSGGQKQRVLLARALYKEPKILALDEATSHLDVRNEARVNLALAELNLTRIMVAHRPETISAAERVIGIQNGKALEVRNGRAAAA
ncbi:peptidase domain-containing ABC transporter [Massilia sp. SR12]